VHLKNPVPIAHDARSAHNSTLRPSEFEPCNGALAESDPLLFRYSSENSDHGFTEHAAGGAAGMVLTNINQLWVADITYIRLQWEFVYLAVVLDAFSRRCLGWALRRSLESALVLEALRMALMRRRPRPGLVHHSDRGVQYASRDYTAQLEQHGIRISMSRLATPYDNARAESFMKTLKYEEVYRNEYRDLEEARALIKQFLEKVYNQQRLHSALDYRPPLEFERGLRPSLSLGKGRA
jgi:putative transposase